MIVIRVELHSAITREVTELARMHIANDGTSRVPSSGSYTASTLRGRSTEALNAGAVQRTAKVLDWPRQRLHVWNLVAEALKQMGYGRG